MSSGALGLGIIGCGQISQWHLRAGAKHGRARWVAACDVRPEAVDERADEFDIPGRYTRVEDLLADPAVDAVIVATGPEAHREPTVAALEAGRHVLVEKPVAVSASEVEAMLAAQGELVGACCSSRFRSTAAAGAATEIIASGELGPVRRLSADILQPPRENYDGTSPFFLHRPGWGGQGVLADWGCYDLDYLLGLTGWAHELEVVLGEMSGLPGHFRRIAEPANDVEVCVGARARLSGGVILDYRRAMFAAVDDTRSEWRIECDDGALDLNMLPGSPQVTVHRYRDGEVETSPLVEEPFAWDEIHIGPVADFIDAVLDGGRPMTTLENALTLQRLTDAIYQSARTGETVEVG
ncbi:MAG: Gfo/Idh/MocA family oxidoreductase [Armatimonadetes bacterium]|nr:Gfo/Idh/MocA family oxidoreductase [Armatimonadota bacterium]